MLRRHLRLALLGAVHSACITLLIAKPTSSVLAAEVEPAAAIYQFDIPAGPLVQTLTAFAELTNANVAYPPKLVRGLRSSGISGEHTPDEALRQLLDGTGLVHRYVRNNAFTIEKVPATSGARTLGPVRVEGQSEADGPPKIGEGVAMLGGVRGRQDEETDGYRPVVSTVGSGRPVPIEDNARSVSVLTQQQMQDQNVNDLSEALARLPGVAISDDIYSRGQQIQKLQIDGGAAQDLQGIIGNPIWGMTPGPELANRVDLAAYERVELLRGVNAAATGDGSFGGTLNLVRKRPGLVPEETLTVTSGSWNRLEGQYDVTIPNLAGSNVAFRGVLNLQTTEAFYDKFERDNGLLYGILDVPLSTTSRGELGARYSRSRTDGPYQAIQQYADGPVMDVPRSTNFGPNWGYIDGNETEVFARIKTDFSPDWNVNIGLTRLITETATTYANPGNYRFLSNGTKTTYLTTLESNRLGIHEYGTKSLVGDVRLAGKLETWGMVHHLFAQASYSDTDSADVTKQWNRSFSRPVESIEDLFLDDIPRDSRAGVRLRSSIRRVQASVEDLMTWRDKVDLRLALSNYRSEMFRFTPAYVWEDYPYLSGGPGNFYFASNTEVSTTKPNWTPTYAVILKPWRGLSIAPSYAEGTSDQSSYYTPAGERLGPAQYQNRELMVRYTTADWIASGSYYTADNSNVAEPIPNALTCGLTHDQSCFFPGGATIESSGFDLEVAGELFDRLNISASYNYNDTRRLSTNRAVNGQAPETTAKLFLSWKPSVLPRFAFNFGYAYRADVYMEGQRNIFDDAGAIIGTLPYNYMIEGHHLFDAGVKYEFSPSLKLAVLVENLTDEAYFSTVGFYGRPRNISLSLQWQDPSIARWGGRPSAPNHYPFGDPSRWYTALDLGYHASSSLAAESPKRSDAGSPVQWDWQFGSNFLTFWRLGRHVNENWRLELEAGYRPTQIETTLTAGPEPAGVCSTEMHHPQYPDCQPATGKLDSFTAMLNGLYSPWGSGARVAPFVGLGLGAAVSQVEIGGRLSNLSASGGDIYAGTDDIVVGPAAQAIAGLMVKLGQRLSADLTYRYFYVPDLKWRMGSEFQPPASTWVSFEPYGLNNFSGDLEDHSVTFSLRWNFDLGAASSGQ